MSLIVCPLCDVETVVAARRPSHLITLLDPGAVYATPAGVAPQRHLRLGVYDIADPMPGMQLAGPEVVASILEFAAEWGGAQPMVVHCQAGISRSTATAFILACAKSPRADEGLIAQALRRAAPHARPNRRIVALADDLLARRGRMVAAVESIGEGVLAAMGAPFDFAAWH